MSGWKMFMAVRTGFCQRSFRRYGAHASSCPIGGYHNAEVVVDAQILAGEEDEAGIFPTLESKSDVRWPKACRCGYVFHPEDNWQINVDRLFGGALDGKLYRLRDLPPGGVWRATWLEGVRGNRYSNTKGEVWAVQMPSMVEFMIYANYDGGRWTVEGELPRVTVSPSINQVGSYHGYIRDGIISEDCEGRSFPGLARTA